MTPRTEAPEPRGLPRPADRPSSNRLISDQPSFCPRNSQLAEKSKVRRPKSSLDCLRQKPYSAYRERRLSASQASRDEADPMSVAPLSSPPARARGPATGCRSSTGFWPASRCCARSLEALGASGRRTVVVVIHPRRLRRLYGPRRPIAPAGTRLLPVFGRRDAPGIGPPGSKPSPEAPELVLVHDAARPSSGRL